MIIKNNLHIRTSWEMVKCHQYNMVDIPWSLKNHCKLLLLKIFNYSQALSNLMGLQHSTTRQDMSTCMYLLQNLAGVNSSLLDLSFVLLINFLGFILENLCGFLDPIISIVQIKYFLWLFQVHEASYSR